MSKQKAFVKYTKEGKIVPGSLIISTKYPERSGDIWREVSMNLCCDVPSVLENLLLLEDGGELLQEDESNILI